MIDISPKKKSDMIARKMVNIARFFCTDYDTSVEEILEMIKASETYKIITNPEFAVWLEGDVALYRRFEWEFYPLLCERKRNKYLNTGLLNWMKSVYSKAMDENWIWKPLYNNNMPGNGVEGVYTDMFFKADSHYDYLKFTIQYMSRCDESGISHPEDGVKYYILHSLEINDLQETFVIPEPTDDFHPFNQEDKAGLVNNYGRFRYVFDDEETPKKVAHAELLQMLYPRSFLFSVEDSYEWGEFVKSFEVKTN